MKPNFLLWLLLALPAFQNSEVPPYLRQGDRIEQEFREYRERLNGFYQRLRDTLQRDAPGLVASLEGEPPLPVVFGYKFLPKLIDQPPSADPNIPKSRSYSWPLSEGYVRGEGIKLDLANEELKRIATTPEDARPEPLSRIVRTYRDLVGNQKTVDQHIQYNRFWQRAVAADRARYDQLTEILKTLQKGDADMHRVIGEALGNPDVPAFIRVVRSPLQILLRVPIYTDITDDAFLAKTKSVIEDFWQARDGDVQYRVEVEWRRISLQNGPRPGEHLDLRAHAATFPQDGAVLTTGAESTYAVVGRFIALGSADTSYRTIAHEFGHVLGFRDGYLRGYKDLGSDGFEIMELIPNFDDLMSAPGQGRVQITHFKLLLANLPK